MDLARPAFGRDDRARADDAAAEVRRNPKESIFIVDVKRAAETA